MIFVMTEEQKKRFSEALERLAGDEEMLVMLANIAVEDAPELMSKLQQSIAARAGQEIAGVAHALKGLLSTFEIGEPVSELAPLIHAARSGDVAGASENHDRIKTKLCDLLSEIESIVA